MNVLEQMTKRFTFQRGTSIQFNRGCWARNVTHIDKYEPLQLSSSRLFLYMRGTVLTNWILWAEQLLLILICMAGWLISTIFLSDDRELDSTRAQAAFHSADRMSGLAAFLLAFYTSLTVSRWWRLRTQGVGNIWTATSQLMLLLSGCVTRDQDEQALSAIRRFARASLAIQFLKRRYQSGLLDQLGELVDRDILTWSEVEALRNLGKEGYYLSESLWAWVMHIVVDLYHKGQITSEHLFSDLLRVVDVGRSGTELITAQMGTPIPMQYIHLIGLLVKTFNLMFAALVSFLLATADINHSVMPGALVRLFFEPFMYNAILLINAELADPFIGGVNDFPLETYEKAIEMHGRGYIQAGVQNNMPTWMQERGLGFQRDMTSV